MENLDKNFDLKNLMEFRKTYENEKCRCENDKPLPTSAGLVYPITKEKTKYLTHQLITPWISLLNIMILKPEGSRNSPRLYSIWKSLAPSWMKLPKIKMQNQELKILMRSHQGHVQKRRWKRFRHGEWHMKWWWIVVCTIHIYDVFLVYI